MQTSRKDIYSYVATLFTSFTKNIYRISVPETLSSDATTNGFMVLKLDDVRDFSEISLESYSQVRMYVEFYTPSTNTSTASGVMNTTKFDAAQIAIDNIISAECNKQNQTYSISKESILSTDDFFTNKTNSFYVYITSFLIII